ncbi:MAG: hypothetical protein ABI132_04405 [Rhodanobacteraceae bacterium]
MRWKLIAVALLGFAITFASHSPGLVALGVIVGLICGIGAALAFVDAQIRASSRPEHMTQAQIDALKTTLRLPPSTLDRLPPPDPT